VLGTRGELTGAFDKIASMEMAGSGGLNDFGSGISAGLGVDNVGPVSVTLRQEIAGPPVRRVRVTLVRDVDRILIDDEILEHITSTSGYGYRINLTSPQVQFEEVGAMARPGLAREGGDFLAGTRADYMTLNHFVTFREAGAGITLSNWDAFAMRVGNSTQTTFDLKTPEVSVLALGNLAYGSTTDQGGDSYLQQRFALQGESGPLHNSQAMQISLAHQNPLQAIPVPHNQLGPLAAPTASFLSVDAPNVAVTALKPAEEGDRGWVVRLWELDGVGTHFNIDVSAFGPTAAYEVSLIETDVAPAALTGGVIQGSIEPNQIKAYRFDRTSDATPSPSQATPTPGPLRGDLDGDGHITAADLAGLIAALFLPSPPFQSDVNADGATTSCDLSELIRQIGTR
jgi:alpha-mannosidase